MTADAFELPSFAKINWQLQVLGKRDDGFHDLCTVFQTVSLNDALAFEPYETLAFECDSADIPADDSNLVVRAAHLLRSEFGVREGARIFLRKRIPAPGGLGGGSSNAATALLGLAGLWDLKISSERLATIGAQLGSDVPFFLTGGTALGTGRGTEIEALPDVIERYMIIVTPEIGVSTAEAFRRLDASRLTKVESKRILKICRKDALMFNQRRPALKNDFEASVFISHPEIKRVKDKLLELGAADALMSGSGASVFAVFDKEETRQATLKALEAFKNWRKFAVATVSRNEFREALGRVRRLFPISF